MDKETIDLLNSILKCYLKKFNLTLDRDDYDSILYEMVLVFDIYDSKQYGDIHLYYHCILNRLFFMNRKTEKGESISIQSNNEGDDLYSL